MGKMKTLKEIQDEVVSERYNSGLDWNDISPELQNDEWPEVCRRAQLESVKEIKSTLSELLAVMHGDGGHYEQKYGTVKATQDAMALLHTKWKSPNQVIDCCKATLEKASECVEFNFDSRAHIPYITSEENIVIIK